MHPPLPVLGEPFAVELANTRYDGAAGFLDVFDEPVLVRRWFAAAPAARPIAWPRRLRSRDLADLRTVRDAVRALLLARVDGRPADPAAVNVLNRRAARAAARLRLDVSDPSAFTSHLDHEGPVDDVLVATVATRGIQFLASHELERVRRCERPGCPMLFVQHHGRRRFCHDGCSHRLRQARYARTGPRPGDAHRTGAPA